MGLLCRCAAVAALAVLPALPGAAEEAPVVARGTQGLKPVALSVANAGPASVDCQAATAHWYSVALGTVLPGARLRRTLWTSVESGEVFVLNAHEDRMPVIDLWCGIEGRSWATRTAIPLRRLAGAAQPDIDLTCREADGALACR